MARFEIPAGWTAQAYLFALDPTPAQADALLSHAGGARFAYNVMMAAVKANLDQRAAERSYGIVDSDLTPCLELVVSVAAQRVEPSQTHRRRRRRWQAVVGAEL